ncbi:UNVERIFIED_CONTAM: Methionine aminopeptidase 1A [Sesamum angustifolium]|uniref:Methionine aminopeptidase 1A n=1 Tax=Sesamum angustifolium TaxID=2727405 RepID=A0AAW2RHX5_9LAMI
MAGGSDAVETATLSCAKCGKPAHLQCPKCVELKLPAKVLLSVKPGVRFREIGEVINRHASMSGFLCGEILLWSWNWRLARSNGLMAGTAVTADGKRSAQFEHTLLVTDTGLKFLRHVCPHPLKCFLG